MKIRNKELREIAANPNDEGAPVCAELLTLRREVRRLKGALRLASALMRDPMADSFPRVYMRDAMAAVAAALKPRSAFPIHEHPTQTNWRRVNCGPIPDPGAVLSGRPSRQQLHMTMADLWSARSVCSRSKVGAIITSGDMRRVLAIGYNGPAKGLPHSSCTGVQGACGCLHAEDNAIAALDSTIEKKIIFVTHSPCRMCAQRIVQAGIRTVVYLRRREDVASAIEVFSQCGIDHEQYTGSLLGVKIRKGVEVDEEVTEFNPNSPIHLPAAFDQYRSRVSELESRASRAEARVVEIEAERAETEAKLAAVERRNGELVDWICTDGIKAMPLTPAEIEAATARRNPKP